MVVQQRLWFLMLASSLVMGCGTKPAAPPVTETELGPAGSVALNAAAEAENAKLSATNSAMPIADANVSEPVRAVQSALAAVQTGNLQQAYNFLPERYQQDIDQLTHEFAEKMDPETWEQLFAVLRKGTDVLRRQKPLIMDLLAQPGREVEAEALSKNWDGLVDSLDIVFQSELSDLERLKQASSRKFLETTVNKLFGQLRTLSAVAGPNPIDQLSQVKVELIDQSAEKATLRISPPNGAEPEETTFVVVDGKWIPESLASSWDQSIADAREKLEALTPEVVAAQKPRLKQTLGIVDASFNQMLEATTAEELQAAAFPLILQGLQMGSQFQSPAAPSDGITLIVQGELDDDAQTKLLGDLEELTDQPSESTYSAAAGGGETTITLRPVQDPVAFAEKLSFAKSKTVDAKQRIIRITLE